MKISDTEKRVKYFASLTDTAEDAGRVIYAVTRWDGAPIGVFHHRADVDTYYRDYNIYTVIKTVK